MALTYIVLVLSRPRKKSQVKRLGIFVVEYCPQQALQMQREENKLVRKALSRKQREAEKQRQFELKQQKRKEKHRGR